MDIVTLTLNPALDKSAKAEQVIPEEKIRCESPICEPGGGGINVSRAIKKLEGNSLACLVLGGYTGQYMNDLLKNESIETHIIKSKSPTRENLMVYEKSTQLQYRFGMPGHELSENEWQKSLNFIKDLKKIPKFVVASGSLPPGVPVDFYARLARITKKKGIKLIVDTSGEALKCAADEGLCLLKPNLSELANLAGKEKISHFEQEEVAQDLVAKGRCEMIVVSLGPRGAMMVSSDHIEYIVPPTVKHESKVGAGDSMVAGMVLSMMKGWKASEVARYGVAAGTAATMTSGSELCNKDDTEVIYRWLRKHRHKKV